MSDKKVIFLLPSLHAGGAEGVVKRLAEALSESGFDVSVVTLDSRNQLIMSSEIEVMNLSRVEGTSSKLRKLLAVPKQLTSLYKVIRKNKDAVFVSFLERPIVLLGLLATVSDVKGIASFRNHTSTHLKAGRDGFMGRIVEVLYKWLITVASMQFKHLDFLSYSVQDDFFNNFISKQKIDQKMSQGVIYNGYDIPKLNERSEEVISEIPESYFSENFVCTSSGRMTEQKGQLDFLPVVARVVRGNSRIKFIFIGEGPDYEKLKTKAQELNLTVWELGNTRQPAIMDEASVILTGYLDNPFSIIKRSRLFVFPSKWEGFGNALIEALSIGVPALSADCPVGPREILDLDRSEIYGCASVKGRGGYLMPLIDLNKPTVNQAYDCWISKILELSSDHAQLSELSSDASRRALDFDEEKQKKLWSDLILKLTDRVR